MNLSEFWLALDAALVKGRLSCRRAETCAGGCCDFKKFNHEPDLAFSEFQAIRNYLQDNGMALPPQRRDICRFLDAKGKCLIYPVRPTLCRVFFCSSEPDRSMQPLPNAVLDLGTRYDNEHPEERIQARPLSSIIDEIWISDEPEEYFY